MKYYSREHEWVKLDGDDAIIGITGFVAKELGDITYVELPREGADFIVGDSIGIVESVKDSVDVYCPVSGTVIAINRNLDDDPGIVEVAGNGNGVRIDDLSDEDLVADGNDRSFHDFEFMDARMTLRSAVLFGRACPWAVFDG